jgi:hypothetical protein
MTFSDHDLGLKPRWFTGKEWADGTAERELIREYKEALARRTAIEMAKPKAQRDAERRKKKFQKWFAYSLERSP